jgi:TolB-like protein
MRKKALLFLSLILLVSCAKKQTVYFHPDVNLAYVKKVAVLPFENLTKDDKAGDVIRDVFVTELLSSGLFEVIAYGETLRALKEGEVKLGEGLSTAEAKKMGKRLGVQGIIAGTVNEFGMTGQDLPIAEASISARMIEIPSGVVVWKASRTVKGVTLIYRLFGLGGKSRVEVAAQAVRDLVGTLK